MQAGHFYGLNSGLGGWAHYLRMTQSDFGDAGFGAPQAWMPTILEMCVHSVTLTSVGGHTGELKT